MKSSRQQKNPRHAILQKTPFRLNLKTVRRRRRLAFYLLLNRPTGATGPIDAMNPDFPAQDGPAGPLADRLAAIGLSPKKAVEYLALFVVLTGIYYFYFVRDARENACPHEETVTLAQLGVLILKFLCFTSWPFAVVAFWDAEWSSKDAGYLFLAAYVGTNVLWYHKTHCGFCIFAASFRIVPYCFCALVAHSLGAARHRKEKEI